MFTKLYVTQGQYKHWYIYISKTIIYCYHFNCNPILLLCNYPKNIKNMASSLTGYHRCKASQLAGCDHGDPIAALLGADRFWHAAARREFRLWEPKIAQVTELEKGGAQQTRFPLIIDVNSHSLLDSWLFSMVFRPVDFVTQNILRDITKTCGRTFIKQNEVGRASVQEGLGWPNGSQLVKPCQRHSASFKPSEYGVSSLFPSRYKWRYRRPPCALTFNNNSTLHRPWWFPQVLVTPSQLHALLSSFDWKSHLRKAASKSPLPRLVGETNSYDCPVRLASQGLLRLDGANFGPPNTESLYLWTSFPGHAKHQASLYPFDQGTFARSCKFQADDEALLKWLQKESVKLSAFKNWRWSANRPTKKCPKCVLSVLH